MPEKHQVMETMTFKFHLFVGVAIFLLFSCISVRAQSPNETISLQTKDIFIKRVYLFFFSLVLCENATNAVSHRMHGIHF